MKLTAPRALLCALTSLAFFATLAHPGDTHACSLVDGPEQGSLPVPDSTTGPFPLLVADVEFEPQLVRVDDATMAPIPLTTVDELAGMFVRFQLTRVWRPTSALRSGHYRVLGIIAESSSSEVTFFVDDTLVATTPRLSDITLVVTLADPEEGSGCAMTSCDGVDFTRLDLTLPADTDVDQFRLEIRNPKTNLRRLELVRTPAFSGEKTIMAWDNTSRFPGSFKRDRLCLTLTPIAEEGLIGETFDLGCFNPDGDDPRVIDNRGCSTGQSGQGSMLIWLLALVLGHRATRRAPPAC